MRHGLVASALRISYVLPLRWTRDEGLTELAGYVASLAGAVDDVIVVDGSPAPRFRRHASVFRAPVRHLPPHDGLDYRMGKVNGVATGIREAVHERVVIADDDVRYDASALARTADLLDDAELVRPQNYFDPLVWHARWDTARTLLNRGFSGDLTDPAADFPGTLAVRRGFLLAIGGYNGDALFENLELIRTVRAAGGRVVSPLDLYVARRPPTAAHFRSQRVRQAYDDFALPLRMATWLALGPALAIAVLRRRLATIGAGAATIWALAELGRRRGGGRAVFPLSATALAPLWVLERALTSWLAVLDRVRGGARYGGRRLPLAATSERRLRRRYEGRPFDAVVAGEGSEQGALSAAKPVSL